MKNLLIIYPHWPPSNLAGVHRARLLANFLPEYHWNPIILTVKPEFYEEKLDWDLEKTVNPNIEVHKVNAFKSPKSFRLIGDIGLRSFFQLYKKAGEIIKSQKIDAILIPIPIYYTALLGPLIYAKYKIPYGIDYIDPWSDGIPGAEKPFTRAWLSNKIANFLEPIALKKASYVTGVSPAYYEYIFKRNWVSSKLPNAGMPYGFDARDHEIRLENLALPWPEMTKSWVYAGAFLPKSHEFIQLLFESIASLKTSNLWPQNHKLYFLGTGLYREKSIVEYAQEANIEELVVEIRDRFPFLEILNFLNHAEVVMVIGTTEKHYTASKTFQAILSKRPVFSMLHHQSSASSILSDVGFGSNSVLYDENQDVKGFVESIKNSIFSTLKETNNQVDLSKLQPYSASFSAKTLADLLNTIL